MGSYNIGQVIYPSASQSPLLTPKKDSGERGVTVDMGTGLSLGGLLSLGIGLPGWRIEHANLFLVGLQPQ